MYLATPSQMKAAEANAVASGKTYIGLMENAGAEVVKKAAILAEGDAADREDIIFLQKLPLFRKLSDGEYNAID